MQNRSNLFNKFKSLGLTFCQYAGPYLIFGGIATDLYIFLAPKEVLESQNCEAILANRHDAKLLEKLNATFIEDTGIFVFNIVGTTRAVVIPVSHWAYKQIMRLIDKPPTFSEETVNKLERGHNEVLKSVSAAVTVLNFPLEAYIKYPSLIIAAVPLARLYLHKHLIAYPGSASLQTYKEIYPNSPHLVRGLASIESLSTGYNVSSAMSALSYFLFDVFYDSVHPQDWRYQNELIYGLGALGFMVGALSIFHEPSQTFLNSASTTIQMAYLIAMPIIATLSCLQPDMLNMDGFYAHALPWFLLIAVFSSGTAEVYRRLSEPAPNKPAYQTINEADSDESSDDLIYSGRESSSYSTIISDDSECIISVSPLSEHEAKEAGHFTQYGTFFLPDHVAKEPETRHRRLTI